MSRIVNPDDIDFQPLRIYRLTNITCVPKTNTKIPSDRVLAYALKTKSYITSPQVNPKKKGYMSIEISKISSDKVLVPGKYL